MNRIPWLLGIGVPLTFLVINALLFIAFDPPSLVYGSLFGLAVLDRIFGAAAFLPPFVSWALFGFFIGALIHFFLWEARRVSDTQRMAVLIMAGCILLGVALVQPLLAPRPAATAPQSPAKVTAPWWRPDSYREAGAERVYNGVAFVWAPPGGFVMGSPTTERERTVDEIQREVGFQKGFWIAKRELTWEIWTKYMSAPPKAVKKPPEDPQLPVFGVTFGEAQLFTEVFSKVMGHTYRLPTEAEWEYACRAGGVEAYSFGGDAAELPRYAWFVDNSGGAAHSVGKLEANNWHLQDVHGNVAEWCQGVLGGNGEGIETQYQVYRGGGWQSPPAQCRAAARSIYLSGAVPPPMDIGIRLVRVR